MPQWLVDILKIIVPSIIIAVFTSYLTVRLSINQFYKEKWWERRMEAYSKLFKALHHLQNYASEQWDDITCLKNLTEEREKDLAREWRKYSHELKLSMDLASFHLSTEAVNILDEYQNKKEALNSSSRFEYYDKDLVALNHCFEKLKKAAKRDLKI